MAQVVRARALAVQVAAHKAEPSALDGARSQVGSIVSTITGIAEQTNLLALNAAIEAAALERLVGQFNLS